MEEFFKRLKQGFVSKEKSLAVFRNNPLGRFLIQDRGGALFIVLVTIAMNLVFFSSAMLAISYMFRDNKNVSEILRLKRTARKMASLLSSPAICTKTVLAHADERLSSTDDVAIKYIKLGKRDGAFFAPAPGDPNDPNDYDDEESDVELIIDNKSSTTIGDSRSPFFGIETGYQPKKVKVFSIKFSTAETVSNNTYQTLHGSLKITLGKGKDAVEGREFVFEPVRMRVLGDPFDSMGNSTHKGQILSCMLLAGDKNVFMLSCPPGEYLQGYKVINNELRLQCIEGQ